MRQALHKLTGAPTIPQVFISGRHLGRASDTFDAFNGGTLHQRLKEVGIDLSDTGIRNAYDFLPSWLQPRP